MPFLHRPRRQLGASLVEMVVAAGVTAGALGLAVPALDGIVQSATLSAASEELLVDLHLARSEALKRNRRVALCKSADGIRCTTAGGWEQGWIVFHDEDGDGRLGAGEERIARHEALKPVLSVRGNQPVADYISYTALGATRLKGGSFQAGTLTLCRRSAGATDARQVILNVVGRPRLQKAAVASCT